jgi:hypothetical protein
VPRQRISDRQAAKYYFSPKMEIAEIGERMEKHQESLD